MKRIVKLLLCVCLMMLATIATAQTVKWQEIYRVKKSDTIYGIAKRFNITIDELVSANPIMQIPDYTLKKGDQLLIPKPSEPKASSTQPTASAAKPATTANSTAISARKTTSGTVSVGVMLPLHNADGDGQRMLEYYRGILMACDSLKAQGISTVIHSWNVPIDANVEQTLGDANAKKCDIIFGPLYTKQVKPIGDFCRANNIKLVIPFSISGNDVASNDHILQVYQSPQQQTMAAVNAFVERFRGAHAVIIDCNDAESTKGAFTTALRKRLGEVGIECSVTNLKASEDAFVKAFSLSKQNVVVLNTSRSPQLNVALAKLNGLKAANKNVRVSLFGYTEWLMYTKVYLDYYYKYDAYIPTTFYYNPLAAKTANLERSYRRWFKSDLRQSLPRFAITGYDHAQFFIRGMHKFGDKFVGTKQQNSYTPLQTPLKFRYVQGGGMQNSAFMLVHYKPNRTIESISY